MRPRWPLALLEFSPLVAAALVLAVWFSTPATLRAEMLSMTAAGVPARSWFAYIDRRTAASNWLEDDARNQASKQWADVRFAAAAARTSQLVAARFDAPVASRTATSFMLPSNSAGLAPLRDFVRAFPGVEVDAYLVEEPTMPPVILSGGSPLGQIPYDPFAAAWKADLENPSTRAFDPHQWRQGPSAQATDPAAPPIPVDDTDNQVYSFTWQDGPRLYRAYAYAPPQAGSFTLQQGPWSDRLHKYMKIDGLAESDIQCGVCHNTPGDSTSSSGPGPFRLQATSIYVGGPIQIAPKPQFTTRDRDTSGRMGKALASWAAGTDQDTSYVARPSGIASFTKDPIVSAVWAEPDSPETGGQTMLFVATYPSDPRAAYTAWRASWIGRSVMNARLWLAEEFPWLLTAACTLLAISLGVSPLAFIAERRIDRREEAQREVARIQRDAHDRVYNRLTALSKRVDGAAAQVRGVPAENLVSVAADIRGTLADLQAILGADSERNGELEGDALLAQLRATVVAQGALHDLTVEFSAPDFVPALPARLGWDLQCVLDEAITNAACHGGAKHVDVQLSFTDRQVGLAISDDGTCTQVQGETSRESTGIAGMCERLGAWGGIAQLECGGAGCTLSATIPIP